MSGARALLLSSFAVGWAASCSVFPDEAILPAQGEAGAATGAQAGESSGGAPSSIAFVGGADSGVAGEPSTSGASSGGAPEVSGGAPTGGGSNECPEPREILREATADTWIDQSAPGAAHGGDAVLYVMGGAQEQRALLQFSLPLEAAGARLLRATVRLHLQSNADATLAERHLEVSQLERAVEPNRATWNNWGNGATRKWLLPGGDFGLAVASATVEAGQNDGWVTFDVTAAVETALSATSAVPFPLIVREVDAAPTPPAALAFTATEGDDSEDPELLIEYCR